MWEARCLMVNKSLLLILLWIVKATLLFWRESRRRGKSKNLTELINMPYWIHCFSTLYFSSSVKSKSPLKSVLLMKDSNSFIWWLKLFIFTLSNRCIFLTFSLVDSYSNTGVLLLLLLPSDFCTFNFRLPSTETLFKDRRVLAGQNGAGVMQSVLNTLNMQQNKCAWWNVNSRKSQSLKRRARLLKNS